MRFIQTTCLPTITKYKVYINKKLVLTTFDRITAEIEKQMSYGDCFIQSIEVEKLYVNGH